MKGKRTKEIIDFLNALEKNPNWENGDSWTKEELIAAYDTTIGKADTDMEYMFDHAMAHGAFTHEKGWPNYKYTVEGHNNTKEKLQKIIDGFNTKKPRPTNE